MRESLRIARIKLVLFLRGYMTWPSWNGFGVNTDWPDGKYARQIEYLRGLFKKYLPDAWIAHGPEFAAGGVLVMYVWPKNDPRVVEFLKGQESPTTEGSA